MIDKRIRVCWPTVIKKNKGNFVVEKDYQFPGGFYVRHKETPYFLTASRRDIELLVENALAALGRNTGPIIVPTEEELEAITVMTPPIMELLDSHCLGNGPYLKLIWQVLNYVTTHPRAIPLEMNGPP